MNDFVLARPTEIGGAIAAGAVPGSAFIAGGTTVVDLWKLGAFPVSRLVDIEALDLRGIQAGPEGLRFGALERMNAVGEHADVKRYFPLVSQALLLSASPQIRNMGTMGGNLLQRPRSITYRNPDPARQDGPSRFDAIFGLTERSRAPHPSDLAVALTALDASVRVRGSGPERLVKLSNFYRVPEQSLRFDTLGAGELIVALEAQAPFAHRSAYIKIRDRASFQFAVVSAAAALDVEDGEIREARVAAGGVGTIPWRLPGVEAALRGRRAGADAFREAAAVASSGAVTHPENHFKVALLQRTVLRALFAAQGSA